MPAHAARPAPRRRPARPVRPPPAAAAALLLAMAAAACGPAESAQEPSAEAQVEAATRPLPEGERDAARVLGYDGEGRLVTLRHGRGARDGQSGFVCVADDPAEEGHHVACYHESLEPYMARGRELRAEGASTRESIARRWEEIEAGTLPFPEGPSALFSLTAEAGAAEAVAEGESPEPRRLAVLYVPHATAEETGLPTGPEAGLPWLMMPGTPTAHVMIHD